MCKKLIYLVCFVLVLGLVSSASADLISYYDFEGPNPFDDKISGAVATVGANVTIESANPLGNAAAFPDGSNVDNDIVVAQDDAPVIGLSDFTCTAWVKRATGTSNPDGICDMVADTAEGGFQLLFGDPEDFRFGVGGPGGQWMLWRSVNLIQDTAWHHFAVSVDRDHPAGLSMYIDGVLDSTGDPTGFASVSMAANQDFQIGSTNDFNLNGLLDELAIFDTALAVEEIQKAMKGIGVPPELAADPNPTDATIDVPRDVLLNWSLGEFAAKHDVYFGTTFSDVNEADRANPANVLVSQGQDANAYDPPGLLEFGQTYYWRIDEVNAPPDFTIYKGDVWSFTVEPVGYPIAGENMTATASSSNSADEGPENTMNGSGLDADDLHSTESTDMWLSSMIGAQPTWIQYEFDRVYKLHQMRVWNYNTLVEAAIGLGVKDATIEYSVDGNDYTTLDTTHEFARAPGAAGYAANTTVGLGVAAKYVKITANSNWGGILAQYGLSEVRFFYIPVWTREPYPEPGTTDMDVDNVTLSWRAGRDAASHEVYLSTDEQAVIDETISAASVPAGSSYASYNAGTLDLSKTYYWKVNEVNEAETPTAWQADVWNFTTQEYLVVDDFESYNEIPAGEEGSNLVYLTWIDGFENPLVNGSTMGHAVAFEPSMESVIVHSGEQSAPFYCDNSTAGYSEATANIAELQVGQDWTKHSIKSLSLWFNGDPDNSAEQMYVKLNGSKVAYDSDADNITRTVWQPWNIDLADFTGVNLSNVTELSIGLERSGAAGGKGVVYFDDIRLYTFERELITPTEPNTAGLMAYYEFEGTYNDSSGNNHTGIAMGSPTFVAGKVGQAISLDGRHDYVEIPDYNGVTGIQSRTCCAWIKTTKGNEEILSWGQNVASQKWVFRTHVNGAIRAEVNGGYIVGGSDLRDDRWHHVVAVFETDETPDVTDIRLYVDGVQEAISAELSKAIDTAIDGRVRIGKSPWSSSAYYFEGLIDDVRIYDYALSDGEVAWLAGRTKPFDKPF